MVMEEGDIMYTSVILLILFMLSYFIYVANKNTKNVHINRINLNPDQKINCHKSSLNILHLSDLHLENLSISPTELYRLLKNEKIDLIAMTGDFLDRKRSIPKLVPYLKALNNLTPTHGIYAVFGNHDYV
jgi:uncharacterized protein